jgi:glycerol-3-phosphate dehydrogenase (NAD(P)+)
MQSSVYIPQSSQIFQRVGVAGGGAWGTALAACAKAAGRDVKLWVREPEVAEALSGGRGNPVFLPGMPLPMMGASTDIASLGDCDAILAVAPAQHLRATLKSLAPHLKAGMPLALCSKVSERGTL